MFKIKLAYSGQKRIRKPIKWVGNKNAGCLAKAKEMIAHYATNEIPLTASFGNTFDTNNLSLRNTFYWGPRQYADLSPTSLTALTTNQIRGARMQHWLASSFALVGNTLSMERDPSPDTAGSIEGQKTWYDYDGKTNSAYEGTQVLPLFVARILPDGSTRFTRTLRNSLGAVTSEVSTYSSP